MAFFGHLVLCSILATLSTSELVIDVQPNVISPEITRQLVINCSITNNQVQHLRVLKSLTLSRYNEKTKEFNDLFTLNSSTLDLKQQMQLKYSQVSFGNLYITLSLPNPTQFDAKIYRCNATGDNADGTNISVFAKKAVEYETNTTALIEEIRHCKKNENFCKCSLKKVDHVEVTQKSRFQFYGSSEIIQELIEPLTLKCLFKTLIQGQKETSTLQSLYIIHEINGVIAFINKQQPVVTTIIDGHLKNVEGEIFDNESKDSYLQVTWNNLKHSESGNYFCEAHINRSDGRFDKLNDIVIIIVRGSTLDDLVKVIQKLQRQAEVDKESLQNNEQKIKAIKEDLDNNKQSIISIKDDLNAKQESIIRIKEDLDTKQHDIISLKEDMNTTEKDIIRIKEDVYTNQENILSITENIDTNKHNMSSLLENLTMVVANVSTAFLEVQNQIDEVNKLPQRYFVPPTSCRNVTSPKARVIVTLASGLKVMCDTKTDGGGWIIFQRRINGNVNFYRGWNEYRDGFGDYNIGEFYLGNENIFKLTSDGLYDLRIDLEFKNKTYFVQYNDFNVFSETDKYKLHIVGKHFGNAGDSLSYNNFMFFSTFDRDNDKRSDIHCAQYYVGAWWHNGCHYSNLNGKWGSKLRGEGLMWYAVTGYHDGVSFSEMKIRERT
ncbi:BgiBFREP17.3 [Biomphalaria glabrata]|nr:BgiBFREP17.3 [Biomphalaria glabrata]